MEYPKTYKPEGNPVILKTLPLSREHPSYVCGYERGATVHQIEGCPYTRLFAGPFLDVMSALEKQPLCTKDGPIIVKIEKGGLMSLLYRWDYDKWILV